MLKNYKRGLCILSTVALMIAASTLNGQDVKWRGNAVKGPDDQMCSDVATDGAGNVYAVGTFKTGAFFNTHVMANADPGGGFTDGYVCKYDRKSTMITMSNPLWSVQFKQSSGTGINERVSAIATYPDGQGSFYVYVVGSYSGAMTVVSADPTGLQLPLTAGASGSQAGFIAKYDADDGALIWATKIDGAGTDTPIDVCTSPDGSGGVAIYVTGSYNANLTQPTTATLSLIGTGTAGFLMRFDDLGAGMWARGMGSTTLNGNDSYFSVASSSLNGDVVVTGQIRGAGTIHTNGLWSLAPFSCGGAYDFIVVRYDKAGTLIYVNNGGGAVGPDAGLAAAVDMYGNSYFAGYYSGTCGFGVYSEPNLGGWDYFILKLDPVGNYMWMKSGGTSNDDAIQSIVVNNIASRVYVAGNFKGAMSYETVATSLSSYSLSNIDGFMLAIDAMNGPLLPQGELQFGGADGDDNGRAIAINAAEDVYIGSSVSSSTANMDWVTANFSFLTNTNPGSYETGLIRWDHSDWPALASWNTCGHMAMGEWWNSTVAARKISMVGYYQGANVIYPPCLTMPPSILNSHDVALVTTNTFGDHELSVPIMDGTAEEIPRDGVIDASGNCFFTGYAPSGSGQTLHYAGTALPGYSTAFTGTATGFLAKTDKAGVNIWGVFFTPLGTGSKAAAQGMTIDSNGDIYVTGGFTGRVQFNSVSGSSPTLYAGASGFDIFVVKYSSAGNVLWVKNFGSASNGSEMGFSISVDNNVTTPAYYVTGEYNSAGALVFGSNSLLATVGGSDIFVMKGDATTANLGIALKGIQYVNSSYADTAYDVISPNSSECYITAGINNSTQCFTASVDFSPANPVWVWMGTNSGTGAATCMGTDLIMGNNGSVLVSGYVTNPGTLTFGTYTEPVNYHGFLVSYTSWAGMPICLEVYDFANTYMTPNPPNRMTRTHAIALESGANSPDHGDNVLVGGSRGGDIFTNLAYAHKITTEGCVVSQRRPNPTIPSTVSESSLYSSLVYPNPLNGSATLEIRTEIDFSSAPFTVVITDMTGREVSRIEGLTSKLVDINAENFSDGLYYYNVVQENKMISNGKMVVSH